jgi:hypothetical protein
VDEPPAHPGEVETGVVVACTADVVLVATVDVVLVGTVDVVLVEVLAVEPGDCAEVDDVVSAPPLHEPSTTPKTSTRGATRYRLVPRRFSALIRANASSFGRLNKPDR